MSGYSIHQEVRRFAPLQLGADGRLYRYQVRGPICNEWGCNRIGFPCWLSPTDARPYEYLCWQHIEDSGFCVGCGQFWAGIESFDFRRSQLCDNCASEVEDDDDWGESYAEWDDDLLAYWNDEVEL